MNKKLSCIVSGGFEGVVWFYMTVIENIVKRLSPIKLGCLGYRLFESNFREA